MKKDEGGYIVVETLISFMLFVILITTILSLVNITTLQSRVHHAMTETAETISVYSYVLDVMGAADHLQRLEAKADKVAGNVDEIKGSISDVITQLNDIKNKKVGKETVSSIYSSGKSAFSKTKEIGGKYINDPKAALADLASVGITEGLDAIFGELCRSLVGHYLQNGDMDGDEYLEWAGVEGGLDGLDFYNFSYFKLDQPSRGNSMMMTADGDVRLIVNYDIDYSFGALILPKKYRTIHVTQTVKTRAWLGGDGERYSG